MILIYNPAIFLKGFTMVYNNLIKSCLGVVMATVVASYAKEADVKHNIRGDFPKSITINGIAQNPEGIEFNKKESTFLLSSLNAMPIIKVNLDGTYKAFSSGEKFPLSTAGLQIDYKRDRLLVAGFNGLELMDNNAQTKGASFLRVYNLTTGMLEKDINLNYLVPDAQAYFANDIALDDNGNAYISDWYARVIYKVDVDGKATLFWKNTTGIPSGPNGIDFHKDGYLLVSLLNVDQHSGLYRDFALVKISLNNPTSTTIVDVKTSAFSGFDGMVLKDDGKLVGVTNNQKTAGGNTLIQLKSDDDWRSAKLVNTKAITTSTTVAITKKGENYVINQDFMQPKATNWKIQRIDF